MLVERENNNVVANLESKSRSENDEPVFVEMSRMLMVAYFRRLAEILRLVGARKESKIIERMPTKTGVA